MRWESINDKKPKLGQQVLCYYEGTRHDKSSYMGYRVLYYLKYFRDTRRRCFADEIWHKNIGKVNWPVTHWCELIPPNQEHKNHAI